MEKKKDTTSESRRPGNRNLLTRGNDRMPLRNPGCGLWPYSAACYLLREALAIDVLPPIVPEQEATTEIQPDTLAA